MVLPASLGLYMVVLAACTAPSEGEPDTDTDTDVETGALDTGVDDTAYQDTSPPPVEYDRSEDLEVIVLSSPVCGNPERRAAAPFLRYELTNKDPELNPQDFLMATGGPAVCDVDGDGLYEIFVPIGKTSLRAFSAYPHDLQDRTLELLKSETMSASASVIPADYDGDGDLDIMISRTGATPQLLRNDGGAFVNVTVEAGVVPGSLRSNGSSWADVDGDGDLDLFIANYGPVALEFSDPNDFGPGFPSYLLLNNGDGTFRNASSQLPAEAAQGYTYVGAFIDVDSDGAPDLYLVNDFGNIWGSNVLLRNDGKGHFTADDGSAGLNFALEGMGFDVADFNEDGIPDIVVPGRAEIALMISLGTRWVSEALASGLVPDEQQSQVVAWGGQIDDLDNDGHLDVIVQFGDTNIFSGYSAVDDQPDALFLNQGDNTFVDVGAAWGTADGGWARGSLTVDVNRDGWLDLVKTFRDRYPLVYMAQCGEQGWLNINLSQPGMNRFAIGAIVEVHHGERHWKEWLRAGGVSIGGGNPPELHFGLGDLDVVDLVRVTWPDGVVAEVHDVPTRRILQLVRVDPTPP